MGALIALALLVVPIAEIWVLIQVGHVIGAGWTVLLLVADSVLGAWLIRREGRRAWRALQRALREGPGRVPGREVMDGALVLVGGTLLLTPGFLTDVVGLLCVVPLTRPLVRRGLLALALRRVAGVLPARSRRGSGPRRRPPTIEGSVER